jgi:hypothetical protein
VIAWEARLFGILLKKKDTRHCLTMGMVTSHPKGFCCLGSISILILMVSNICPRKNEYGRYMIFGYYTPAYGINTWADEWHDKLNPNNYIVTHWMFAPDMPEEQI